MPLPLPRWSVLLLLALACGSCGGDVAPTKAQRTRAALEALFAAARAGDAGTVARALVYQGADEARAWKDVYDPTKPDELQQVTKAMGDLVRRAGKKTKAFLEFRAERESEGEWLSWRIETDAGTAWYSCLEIAGRIALGDID